MAIEKKKKIIICASFCVLLGLILAMLIIHYINSKSLGGGEYYIDVEGNIVSRMYDNTKEVPGPFDSNGIAWVREVIGDYNDLDDDEMYFIDKSFSVIGDHGFRNGTVFNCQYEDKEIFVARYNNELLILDQNMEIILRKPFTFADGNTRIENVIKEPGENGLFPTQDMSKGKWGYMNIEGEMVIEPIYSKAEAFSEDGIAVVENEDGLYGAINENGELIIDYQYTRLSDFYGGRALARTGEDFKAVIIDEAGNMVGNHYFVYDHLYSERQIGSENGYACVQDYETQLYGFIDKSGDYVIEPQYLRAYKFSNGRAQVQNLEELWGYIDKNGDEVIECQYTLVGAFSKEGIATAEYEGKWGYINMDGSWLLKPQFKSVFDFSNGYAIVTLEDGQKIIK